MCHTFHPGSILKGNYFSSNELVILTNRDVGGRGEESKVSRRILNLARLLVRTPSKVFYMDPFWSGSDDNCLVSFLVPEPHRTYVIDYYSAALFPPLLACPGHMLAEETPFAHS